MGITKKNSEKYFGMRLAEKKLTMNTLSLIILKNVVGVAIYSKKNTIRNYFFLFLHIRPKIAQDWKFRQRKPR